ncbi:MAG: hypothetical protein ACFFG0_15200, partial [Candidatus Thorarchaeota archaeon]
RADFNRDTCVTGTDYSLFVNNWGKANINLNGLWDEDPVILTINTTSPSLSFNMNTTLYGYHELFSSYNQQYDQGVSYEILDNGTILWELYHNLYMPPEYENFEFTIQKPFNWEFLSVFDPFLQTRNFEYGNSGDDKIHINMSNALFAGWYTLKATSPNYLNLSNTRISKQGQWIQNSTFGIGESTQITTQLKHLDEIPNDVENVILTIYHPNGTIFYTESKSPVGGNVTFSQITFGAFNTSGGVYEYTLFWSNGTALGGLKSEFLVKHQSSMILLKPDDAISDLTTDAFVGDIIPLRIQLKDFENNQAISGAFLSHNWSTGLKSLTEAALGVYEAILDTSELESNGFYEIFINSSKIGFKNYNMTLKINLLEETNLLRLESEYYIELNDNSTVKYSYTNSTGGGITGAAININIDKLYYSITDHLDGNYTIEFDTSYINNLGIYQIELNFSAPAFEAQYAIYQFEIIEQSVEIFVYINSQEIQENSLFEVMFKENISISVRILASIDNIYLTGGNITWNSENFDKEIIEGMNNWFNDTIPLSSNNFSSGLNYIYLRFEQENYEIKNFGFQLLISEQTVNISTFINGQEILENYIKELTFKEVLNVSIRVFANGEQVYLSGANITFICDNYEKDIKETAFPWYNTSIIISSPNFNPGINYVYIKFHLENYTTDVFSFQLLIRAQKINLTVLIDSKEISENYLKEFYFYDEFSISVQSYATAEKVYLKGGIMTFMATDYEKHFTGYENFWYNTTISCSPSIFSLGVNYVYLRFQMENYSTTIFSFQIFIDQIEIQVDSIGFQDTINAEVGETLDIQLRLVDSITNYSIENASVTFTWYYGNGPLDEISPGTYQVIIELPGNVKGSFRVNLIITPKENIYKFTQHSFMIVIEQAIKESSFPMLAIYIIISVLIVIISALGALSLRSYVILPRKRKKESELLAKTQKFKDLGNIQAIVIIHTLSGIPIYSKSYSILEKHKKELFSGFIQAITMIGEEFAGREEIKKEDEGLVKSYGVERIMELDFKQFHCLIADKGEVRAVFILREKSSERLKSQVSHLMMALNMKLSKELEDWDGSLDKFETMIPSILYEYFELYYKESFRLTGDINLIKMKKEKSLSKMELRVINVIQSMVKDNIIADLNNIVEVVSEENKDLIINAIESLIDQKIIIPINN